MKIVRMGAAKILLGASVISLCSTQVHGGGCKDHWEYGCTPETGCCQPSDPNSPWEIVCRTKKGSGSQQTRCVAHNTDTGEWVPSDRRVLRGVEPNRQPVTTWQNQQAECKDVKYVLKVSVARHIFLLARPVAKNIDEEGDETNHGNNCISPLAFHDLSNASHQSGKQAKVLIEAEDEEYSLFLDNWNYAHELGTYTLSELAAAYENAESLSDSKWYDIIHSNCATFILSMVKALPDFEITPEAIEYVATNLATSGIPDDVRASKDATLPVLMEDDRAETDEKANDDNLKLMKNLVEHYIAARK